MAGAWEKVYDYFLAKGNRYMVIITLVEIVFYLAYTVIYSIEAINYKKDTQPGTDAITLDQYYRWCLTAVLLTSLIYFLWHSVSIACLEQH